MSSIYRWAIEISQPELNRCQMLHFDPLLHMVLLVSPIGQRPYRFCQKGRCETVGHGQAVMSTQTIAQTSLGRPTIGNYVRHQGPAHRMYIRVARNYGEGRVTFMKVE